MSINFNGTSTLLELTTAIYTAYPAAFFAWIRPRGTGLSGNCAPASAGNSSAGTENSILTIGGATVRAQVRDGTTSNAAIVTRALSDTWIPVMAVFTSTSSRTIHIGGATAVNNTDLNNQTPAAFNRFRLGARGFDADPLRYQGDIAEVCVWQGTVPDATDFAALAGGAVPNTVKSGSVVDYWALLNATDLTGVNGRTFTATDATNGATHPLGIVISPSAGSVAISGHAPTVSIGGSGSAQPDAGSAVVSGQAPTAVRTTNVLAQPAAGAVVTTGRAPSIARTGSFITEALINNTGTILAAESVVWSWYLSGRIGSLDSITALDGSGTTEADGTLVVPGLALGSGLMLVARQNTDATDDDVYYEAGAVT